MFLEIQKGGRKNKKDGGVTLFFTIDKE